MAWTQEHKEHRKRLQLQRIADELNITLDQAEEVRLERLRNYASKGGKVKGESKVRGDSEYYSRISKRVVEKRYGKDSDL